jgi:hypothetical protein
MRKLLTPVVGLALLAAAAAGCGESRTDRLGEKPDRDRSPSASPTTDPTLRPTVPPTAPGATTPPGGPVTPSTPGTTDSGSSTSSGSR